MAEETTGIDREMSKNRACIGVFAALWTGMMEDYGFFVARVPGTIWIPLNPDTATRSKNPVNTDFLGIIL